MTDPNSSRSSVLQLTRTGVLTALLITLQWITSGTQVFAGQYITGTLVNCVLAVAALLGGFWCGATVAVVSPFAAFLLGIGPKLIQIVPCICLGNLVFVLVFQFISGKTKGPVWRRLVVLVAAAVAKFLTLYIAVVRILIPVMGERLKAPQIKAFSAMFSWPQLVTALAGGTLALLIVPLLSKTIKK